jgi:hypothetical protein
LTTSDWLLATSLLSTPFLVWTFERALDAMASRSRRIWWHQHYRKCAKQYLDYMTSMREFEAERIELEKFRQHCKALVASWQCNEYRKAA